MPGTPRFYTFADFRVDRTARMLRRRDGTPVPLTPRVFDTLLYLVEHCGVVLGKDDLLAAIWPGRVVEENNLSQSISALRRALGSGAARLILTVPGRGYRFVADVQVQPAEQDVPFAGVVVPLLRRPANAGARLTLLPSPARVPNASKPPLRVLAVLPFRPLVAQQRDEALVMGMAEVLIARLSSSRELVVRPLSLARRYDTSDRDPLAAGRELGADVVVDGALQRDRERLRVTARLLRVADGLALWAHAFDVEFTGVFDVQDEIAGRVSEALALRLGGDEKRGLTRRDTVSVDAYQCYLIGRHHIAKLTPAEILKGIALLQQAIAHDPNYARAHATVADAYRRLPIACDWRPTEAFAQAQAAALEALALDETLSEAHFALGFVRFWYEWRWPDAEAAFRRAIELGPDCAEPHLGLAHLLSNLGRQREAITEIRRARELDPLSLIANTLEASFLSLAGRDEEALARLQKVFDIDPHFWVAQLHLGRILLKVGRSEAAIGALRKARTLSGDGPHVVAALGDAYARSGDAKSARACLRDLRALSARRYVPPSNLAVVHCALGESEPALDWLERAYAERDAWLTFIKIDRRWDALRGHPRFATLAGRMGLA